MFKIDRGPVVSCIASVAILLGAVALSWQDHVEFEQVYEDQIMSARLISLQERVDLPDWIPVPDRSTHAFSTSIGPDKSKGRIEYRTLLGAHAVLSYYKRKLARVDVHPVAITPRNPALKIKGVQLSINQETGQESLVTVRDLGAVRLVEVIYVDPQKRVKQIATIN